MSKEFKIFLATFILSLPFWWEINILEKRLEAFFSNTAITADPYLAAAAINQKIIEDEIIRLKLPRNKEVEDLDIKATSAVAVFFDKAGNEKVLFEKEPEKPVPIASLTKLMTAVIVLDNYDLYREVTISPAAVSQESEFGNLKAGEKFLVKDLLYPLLIESSNDTAYALAEVNGIDWFTNGMNLRASELKMNNSYFANPTGLDPDNPEEPINYSTADDLGRLAEYLLKKPFVLKILSTFQFDLYSPSGILHHRLINTNEFLEKRPVWWKTQIIGGKTGWTTEARGCLLLVLKPPSQDGYLVNVILGSDDRFEEMEEMVDWVYRAYKW